MSEQKSDLGTKPRLEFLPPSNLMVDERYQRNVKRAAGKRLINTIVENFYWPFFGVLVATDNGDGTYCLIDGQHRAAAACRHPDIHTVPVMVIEEMTLLEQAQAFVAINQSRIRLTPLQLHRAAVRAGDQTALEIQRICSECGVKITSSTLASAALKPGETPAIKTLYGIYKKHGDGCLQATLETMMQAYRETAGDLRSQLIRAVASVISRYPDRKTEVAERLATLDAVSWQENARARAKIEGGTTIQAIAEMLASGRGCNNG